VLEASVHSVPAEAGAVIQKAREFRNSLKFQFANTGPKRSKRQGAA